jgi:hypothetical protein
MVIPDKNYFLAATRQVIKNFEGGYFHPSMYIKNPSKFSVYGTSGETMFGLDRHAGFDLFYKGKRKANTVQDNLKFIEAGNYEYKNEASKKFWTLLDNLDAKNTFTWNYKGGNNEDKLIELASEIIYPEFLRLSSLYLDEEAQKLVFSEPRLLFHFIYATWNGSGFFKFYAKELNKALEQRKNLASIISDQLNLRVNSKFSQIRSTGEKMKMLFSNENFKKAFDTLSNTIKENSKIVPLLVAGLIITGFIIIKKMQG